MTGSSYELKQNFDSSNISPRVLIIGAGAIGAFYGALLARQGAKVAVVCRSDYQQVKARGFEIYSHSLGQWTFRPDQVLTDASEYRGSADYLILCTKITANLDRVKLIRKGLSSCTSVVFLQNGVEIEQEITDAFPEHEVISGLAFICSTRIQSGIISHLAYGRLVLGNLPEGISDKTLQLCRLFNQSGIECFATNDVVTARWQKSVWNAPFNPLSVLSGGLSTRQILNSQEAFVRCIMQEICVIAAATGHPLPKDIIDDNINSTYDMPPYKTSMLVDYMQGQPMETEVILGNALRAGQRTRTPCPHLASIYALMKLREIAIESASVRPESKGDFNDQSF